MKNQRRGRRYRFSLMAAASVSALGIWTYGCSDDSPGGSGQPDPGGTFGVEALVNVVGAGRVASEPASIDCPQGCGHTFILKPSVTNEVVLTATASNGWRFAGWTFAEIDVPAHGRGPDVCQPIVRKTLKPQGVDTTQNVVKLPAGEVDGRAPEGAPCNGLTKVPVGYSVTAKFELIPVIPDAGADTGTDAGSEGTPLFVSGDNASGYFIFLKGSRLFWWWETSGRGASILSWVDVGTLSGPHTAVTTGSGDTVTEIQLDPHSPYLVYQTAIGGLHTMLSTATPLTPVKVTNPPGICSGVTADATNGYCRSGATIHTWPLAGGTPRPLATGLPQGSDVAVDGANPTNIFFTDSSAVYSLNVRAQDGGAATPTTVSSGHRSPSAVISNQNSVVWLNLGGSELYAKTGTAAIKLLDARRGTTDFVMYGEEVYYLVVPDSTPGASSIERTLTSGGSTPRRTIKSGITNPVGLAVDANYVYWLSADARVFRTARVP